MATAKPKRLTALFVKSNRLAARMYCDGGGLYCTFAIRVAEVGYFATASAEVASYEILVSALPGRTV